MSDETSYVPKHKRNELWGEIGIDAWIAYLNKKKGDREWRRHDKNTILGRSPLENTTDSDPSFYIHLDDGYAYCFSNQVDIQDPVKFVAEYIEESSYVDTIQDVFKNRFGLDIDSTFKKNLDKTYKYQNFLLKLAECCNECLHRAANNPNDDQYKYAQPAVDYLRKRSNLDIINHSHIGVWPNKKTLWQCLDKKYEKEMLEPYAGNYLQSNVSAYGHYGGWLVFPYFKSWNSVGQIKILKPDPRDKTHRWLGPSSQTEELPNNPERGFFGLDMFQGIRTGSKDDEQTAYVVEGEFDQLALAETQLLEKSYPDFITVAGGGGSVRRADTLNWSNIDNLVVVPDNDSGGESFVKTISNKTDQTLFHKYAIFEWPADYPDKDPDDAVQRVGYEDFKDTLLDNENHTFTSKWAIRKVEENCKDIDSYNIRAQKEEIKKYVDVVSEDAAERDIYFDQVEEITGIDSDRLRKSFASIETPEGFQAAIEQQVSSIVRPVAHCDESKVRVYHRSDQELLTIDIDNNFQSYMENKVLDSEISEWVRQKIGEPEYIIYTQRSKKKIERRTRRRDDDIKYTLRKSMRSMVSRAPAESKFEKLKQGVHWADASEEIGNFDRKHLDDQIPDQRVYVVNGRKVYRGYERETGDGSTYMYYEELDYPRDGKYMFSINQEEKWSENLPNEDVLNEELNQDPVDVFNTVYDMIDTGWTFKTRSKTDFDEQKLQSKFLAAHLMSLTISTTFPHLMMLFFNAPSHSGKSKFIKGLVAGENEKSINIIEHSKSTDDYTSAGVTQELEGHTLTTCLDEFEQDDSNQKRSEIVQELQSMIRELGSPGGVTKTRGTAGGESRETTYRFPIMTAAISGASDNQADFNRRNTIQLQREEGHDPPDIAIPAKFGQQRIDEVREALTLLPLQYLNEIHDSYETVRQQVMQEDAIDFNESRFMRKFLPALSILHWLDKDWVEFGQKYVNHFELLSDELTSSKDEKLFRTIFSTNVDTSGMDDKKNPKEILNSETPEEINDVNCGIYYKEGVPYVFLCPENISKNHLKRTEYQNMSESDVYNYLSNHEYTEKTARGVETDYGRIRKFLMKKTYTRMGQIHAVPVEKIVQDVSDIPDSEDESKDEDSNFDKLTDEQLAEL